MVFGVIEIGKRHIRSDRDDRQERMKLHILLRNDKAAGSVRGPRSRTRWVERHDGITDRMAGTVDDTHGQRSRSKRGGKTEGRRYRY